MLTQEDAISLLIRLAGAPTAKLQGLLSLWCRCACSWYSSRLLLLFSEGYFTDCFCQVWMSYAAFEATPQALLGQQQEEEEEQPQANGNTAGARRAAALQAEDPMAAAAREEQARR